MSEGPISITAETIRSFAELTGDRSRIHLDADFAKQSGFTGPIAHGLLTAAHALGAVTSQLAERLGTGSRVALVSSFSVRLSRSVVAGDELELLLQDRSEGSADGSRETLSSSFELRNQREETVASGALSVLSETEFRLGKQQADMIERLGVDDLTPTGKPEVYFAEDILEFGPRGVRELQPLGIDAIRAYAELVGETNPLYLDAAFAEGAEFGGTIVPPMLLFCMGFSAFLRDLLSVEMPATGSAGHIADEWTVHRTVRQGERLRVIHKPVSCRRTKSRPELAVVRFALQFIGAGEEVVQSGVVTMMIPARPTA